MRRSVQIAAVAVLAGSALAVAGCGSDSSDDNSGASTTVNGCEIAPDTQCQNADLSGVVLDGDDANGGDFTGADFSGAELTNVNLSQANLTMASFEGASLDGVDMSGANLTQANLTGATLSDVNLDGSVRCGTVRTDGTIDDDSCPPSGGGTTESTTAEGTTTASTTTEGTTTSSGTTTDSADGVRIASFTVGDADCSAGATTAEVAVEWNGVNATSADFAVDGQAPGAQAGFGGSGRTMLSVPCDGDDHTIEVTVSNAAGETASQTAQVST